MEKVIEVNRKDLYEPWTATGLSTWTKNSENNVKISKHPDIKSGMLRHETHLALVGQHILWLGSVQPSQLGI